MLSAESATSVDKQGNIFGCLFVDIQDKHLIAAANQQKVQRWLVFEQLEINLLDPNLAMEPTLALIPPAVEVTSTLSLAPPHLPLLKSPPG